MCRDTMRDTLTETRVENFDLGGRDLIFRSVAVAAIGYSEFAAARSDADGRGLILIVKIPYTGVHAIRVRKKGIALAPTTRGFTHITVYGRAAAALGGPGVAVVPAVGTTRGGAYNDIMISRRTISLSSLLRVVRNNFASRLASGPCV